MVTQRLNQLIARRTYGICFAHTPGVFIFSSNISHEVNQTLKQRNLPHLLEQSMSHSSKQQFSLPQTRAMEVTIRPLRLTTIVGGLLFMTMSFLTGCGEGETGSDPTIKVTAAGATASLAWNPVHDPSVSAYFVHYGRHSPRQSGSCAYEHSIFVDSPSATLTNLDPDTQYYFAVSAYNGIESACSNEVSTVTPPASV
jgi:hypothetical protein